MLDPVTCFRRVSPKATSAPRVDSVIRASRPLGRVAKMLFIDTRYRWVARGAYGRFVRGLSAPDDSIHASQSSASPPTVGESAQATSCASWERSLCHAVCTPRSVSLCDANKPSTSIRPASLSARSVASMARARVLAAVPGASLARRGPTRGALACLRMRPTYTRAHSRILQHAVLRRPSPFGE